MCQVTIALIALGCGIALDYLGARWVDSVHGRNALKAANLSLMLYVCSLISTVLIIEKCLPAMFTYGLGSWFGTYVAVRHRV